ncbi:hypothetical protein PHSY_004634 [Pseudozyma hubeiensis SY62]|uniref:Methyltransferase type 11 domain-containing protein n=1 Tax=Pseudozyma hubeiensis (strain SY62) TaxID=1305764 RepID=R9PG16_PSEHS|nr:hypothetical protein PHSY_004634 [Pseudozyma hubeiensis SY62]GAC97050.1 hypothetical protein PHSY_004634 [Pseudozyma hubeiensis SY62]
MALKPASLSLYQQQPQRSRTLIKAASHRRPGCSGSHTTFAHDDDDKVPATTPLRRGSSLSSHLRQLFRRLSSSRLSRTGKASPSFEAEPDASFAFASGSSHASSSHLSGLWSPSLPGSESSSTSSLFFPLHPEFELELEIALEMAPHDLGSAWSHDSYNAMQYLRARTPYPPTVTETVFDYHAQRDSSSNSTDRWQSALEIGCGPGQMSIHLATRFARVYGQDPSPNMLKLANTVKHMSEEELAEVHLPAVRDPMRIEFSEARGEDPILPPGEKVDLIMMAACIHWLDWQRPEANWTKWASLLKPGGTLIVTGGRPAIGPYTGEKGDQIRPLRDWLLDFPLNCPEIERYYGTSTIVQELRSGGLYRKLSMPWDHDTSLEALWDRDSYCWIPIDDCTVLGEQATSSQLSKVDDPERFASMINQLPEWIAPSVRRAVRCDNSHGDLIVSMSTPRKMADWVRSSSGYLKFMHDNAEQRKLSLQDQDFVAVELQKVCQSIGIDFDAEIECHHSAAFLAIRRTEREFP